MIISCTLNAGALICTQGRISFGPGAESQLGPEPDLIWAWSQISFGPRAGSHLGPEPNLIRPGAESHLGPEPNLNWARSRIPFGPEAESQSGPEPNLVHNTPPENARNDQRVHLSTCELTNDQFISTQTSSA